MSEEIFPRFVQLFNCDRGMSRGNINTDAASADLAAEIEQTNNDVTKSKEKRRGQIICRSNINSFNECKTEI